MKLVLGIILRMKHTKTIIALGMIVALLPFLGFPSSWKNIMFAVLGLTIATLTFRILAAAQSSESGQEKERESYKQNAANIAETAVAHE